MEARFQVTVPSTYSQPDAALAYWLSNPLLPAGRVAATRERLGFLSRAEKQALIHRLYTQLDKLRQSQPYDKNGYGLLKNLVRHELISTEERVSLSTHFTRLRGAEIDWEFTRLETALNARIDAAHGQAEEEATGSAFEEDMESYYDECERDLAA